MLFVEDMLLSSERFYKGVPICVHPYSRFTARCRRFYNRTPHIRSSNDTPVSASCTSRDLSISACWVSLLNWRCLPHFPYHIKHPFRRQPTMQSQIV
jgi:hypothetical protein